MQAIPVMLPPGRAITGNESVSAIASDDDDWDGTGRSPRRLDRHRPDRSDDVDVPVDQIARHFGRIFQFSWHTIFKVNVLSFHVAERAQPLQKSVPKLVLRGIVIGAHHVCESRSAFAASRAQQMVLIDVRAGALHGEDDGVQRVAVCR
jgi:hypothetical protein